AAIGHPYQALYVTDADGHRTWIDAGFMRDLRSEDAMADPEGSLVLYREWLSVRTADIDLVIDITVGEVANSAGSSLAPVLELIDSARIGVMGHSLGGSAALAVGRSRDDVSAVVALEAPMM